VTQKQEKVGLVIALGLDDFMAEFTIKKIKPQHLVLLVTEKSFSIVNKVLEETQIKSYQIYFIKNIFSTSETIQEFMNGYNWLKEKEVSKIVIDATNSITVIEMATYVSASLIDLYDEFLGKEINFELIYVHAEYKINEEGVYHEIKGTEKLVTLESPKDSLSFVNVMDAIRAFNKGMYEHAYENFLVLEKNSTNEKNLLYSGLKLFSEAYLEWDRLRYEEAYNYLKLAKEAFLKATNFKLSSDILPKLEKNLEVLAELKKEDKISLIFDIYSNAERVEIAKRYDGAVARLYSCLEKMTQFELKKYGILSRDPDYSKLSKEQKEYFEKEIGFLPKELELKKNVLLLSILENKLGFFILKEITHKKFIGLVGIRNKSMFAHGTTPIGEQQFNSFKNKLVEPIFEKFLEIQEKNKDELESFRHASLQNLLSLFEK
jgi:CRISPR-associated protein (TIGR02710 family)